MSYPEPEGLSDQDAEGGVDADVDGMIEVGSGSGPGPGSGTTTGQAGRRNVGPRTDGYMGREGASAGGGGAGYSQAGLIEGAYRAAEFLDRHDGHPSGGLVGGWGESAGMVGSSFGSAAGSGVASGSRSGPPGQGHSQGTGDPRNPGLMNGSHSNGSFGSVSAVRPIDLSHSHSSTRGYSREEADDDDDDGEDDDDDEDEDEEGEEDDRGRSSSGPQLQRAEGSGEGERKSGELGQSGSVGTGEKQTGGRSRPFNPNRKPTCDICRKRKVSRGRRSECAT